MNGLNKAHQRAYSKSQPTCSFCRSPNHRVTDCQHVKVIWDKLQTGVIPLEYMASVQDNDTSGITNNWKKHNSMWTSPLSTYYTNGANWGDLYRSAEKAYASWVKAQAKKTSKKGSGRRKALQTCGYCKETGHTRRTCSHIATDKALLVQANRNFRQWFYKEYVVKQGLSTGSMVSFIVSQPSGYNSTVTRNKVTTLVTGVNWDTINLLSLLDLSKTNITWSTDVDGKKCDALKTMREFLRSSVSLKVPKSSIKSDYIVNRSHSYRHNGDLSETSPFYAVPFKLFPTHPKASTDTLKDWDTKSTLAWGSANEISELKILQRAPQVLADDWIDGFSDEMSVIFKKFSKAQLEFFGVTEHIRSWALDHE